MIDTKIQYHKLASIIRRHIVVSLILSLEVILLLLWIWTDSPNHTLLFNDDAYYYLIIARNLVLGRGLTFDQINPTNGFNPLYLILVLPIYLVAPNQLLLALRIVFTLQLGIMFCSMILLIYMIDQFWDHTLVPITVPFFTYGYTITVLVNGMESGIIFLLILILMLFHISRKPLSNAASHKTLFTLGLLLVLIFLARLDYVFFGVSFIIFAFFRFSNKRELFGGMSVILKRILLILLPCVLLSLPYFFINWLYFGDIFPITTHLKSSFPSPILNSEFYTRLPHWFLVYLFAVGFLIVYIFNNPLKNLFDTFFTGVEKRDEIIQFLGIFSLAIILHSTYIFLFIKWAMFDYWFAGYLIYVFCILLVVICALSRVLHDISLRLNHQVSKKVISSFLGVLLIAVLMLTPQGWNSYDRIFIEPEYDDWYYTTFVAGEWARKNTDEDAIFAMKDCGRFSYYSDRRVINLDGVMNNVELQDYLLQDNLTGYLKEKGVRYFVKHRVPQNHYTPDYSSLTYDFESHYYDSPGSSIIVHSYQEVFFFEYNYTTVQGTSIAAIMIWRIL